MRAAANAPILTDAGADAPISDFVDGRSKMLNP